MSEIPHPLPLEDSWNDVLSKAIAGTGVDDKNLAPSANITPARLKSILAGELPSEDTLRRLAIGLGLRPTPFLDLAFQRYKPATFDATIWKGVQPIASRYMDSIVNCYLIWDSATREAVLCDTGTDAKLVRRYLDLHQLKLTAVMITHRDGDHVAALDELNEAYSPAIYAPKDEPLPGAKSVTEGDEIQIGCLKVRVLLTEGHSEGHVSYVFTGQSGWPAPVAVIGDVLFAGSMGSGRVSYPKLRDHLQFKILALPPKTLLCPGHGPTTTVEQEEKYNPFG